MPDDVENDPEFNAAIPKPSPGRGYRILNILVVLAILTILIAFFLPASRSARPASIRIQCASDLRQITIGLLAYEQTYGALPPAYTVDANGKPLHSWRTLILPYLDEEELYRSIDLTKPWNDPVNAKALNTTISLFRCPNSVGPLNTTTYLAIVAPNSCLIPGKPRRLAEITDAHRSALLLIEAGEESAVPWMAPVDADESLVMNFGSSSKLHHEGGTNAAFVDGHVHFLMASLPAEVRRMLITISGNEQLDQDAFE